MLYDSLALTRLYPTKSFAYPVGLAGLAPWHGGYLCRKLDNFINDQMEIWYSELILYSHELWNITGNSSILFLSCWVAKRIKARQKQKTPKLSCGNKKESGRFKVLEAALFSRGLGTYWNPCAKDPARTERQFHAASTWKNGLVVPGAEEASLLADQSRSVWFEEHSGTRSVDLTGSRSSSTNEFCDVAFRIVPSAGGKGLPLRTPRGMITWEINWPICMAWFVLVDKFI